MSHLGGRKRYEYLLMDWYGTQILFYLDEKRGF